MCSVTLLSLCRRREAHHNSTKVRSRAAEMSSCADANAINKVSDLRRLFDASATRGMEAMQELDRSVCEVSEYVERVQRFFLRKSSEMGDLRQRISDSNPGGVISGYATAVNVIRALEKDAVEREKHILRMKKDADRRNLMLSEAEKDAKRNMMLVEGSRVDTAIKRKLIAEMYHQIVDLEGDLSAANDITTDSQQKQLNKQEAKNKVVDKIISSLRGSLADRNREIETMRETIIQLQKSLLEKENQRYISRRLSNTKKIRQLESMGADSPEIADLLNKLRQEKAIIAEHLLSGSTCQQVNSNASAPRLAKRPLRG